LEILVAVDLSENSEAIVRKSEDIAKSMAARIWLLHVAEPEPGFVGWEIGPESVREGVAEAFHSEHQLIQRMAESLRKGSVDATALLIQGPTVETILKQAAKHDVDLIVVGSHGRSAAYQLLVGSVSEGILRKAQCPVLVIPTRD
jgi:nucleotide-binding universal stress UspA family protein